MSNQQKNWTAIFIGYGISLFILILLFFWNDEIQWLKYIGYGCLALSLIYFLYARVVESNSKDIIFGWVLAILYFLLSVIVHIIY